MSAKNVSFKKLIVSGTFIFG